MTNPSEAMIGKGVEAYITYKGEREFFNIPMMVAKVYAAMQQAATPAARVCICHLQEHGHDYNCPKCRADIAAATAPVQSDDAEWLRDLASKLKAVPTISEGAQRGYRLNRIASRLTPDRVTPLVEALRELHDEVMRAFGVIDPKRKLGKALDRAETALRDGGFDA